ncbi:transcriptional regulator Ifh1p [Diutina catenulata]
MAKSPRKECSNFGGKRAAAVASKSTPTFPSKAQRGGKTSAKRHFQPAGKRVGSVPSRRFSIVDSPSEDDEEDGESPTPLFAVPQKRLPKKQPTKRYPKKNVARKTKIRSQVHEDALEDLEDEGAESDASSVSIDLSFMNVASRRKSIASNFSGDDSSDSDSGSSSDSDVDFVKLQHQHKAKVQAPVKPVRESAIVSTDDESELSDVASANSSATSVEPDNKFGRRKSDAALPEDLNFTFDFDESSMAPVGVPETEDLGEDIGAGATGESGPDLSSDFNFADFALPVPRIEDGSEDEFELDDNELLATLQVDDDDLADSPTGFRGRNHSVDSMDDVDEREFLKEEEKFLVNEFETNGFDEEDSDEDMSDLIELDEHYMPNPDDKITSRRHASSDDDDDSYLWNYFFSSGSDDEEVRISPQLPALSEDEMVVGDGYDSTESTDVDENLPRPAITSTAKAKEVLSASTGDYRPPVLGTWVTVDSKPFGIIDGLSTRTLTAELPRKSRKSVVNIPNVDALGLDELLNVSELDDDETDIKIWQDFNQRQKIPLGAFRNKSAMSPVYDDSKQKVYKKIPRKKEPSAKKSRRKASITEAVSEGYRPTKSGLFSEHVLGDVEEVMGDDREFMNLIKGL